MVIVQLEPAAGGTKVPPGFTAVPTAQVPPSVKAPVPVSCVSVMAFGIHGPASTFVFGLAVLVIVMVPAFTTVLLAPPAVKAGVSGEMVSVAMESWAVSETNSAAPLPTGFTLRVAFRCACDVLIGLNTTLTRQLCPGASVVVPVPAKQVLDAMVKLGMLHPVVTLVHEMPMEVELNASATLPVLMTWT